MYKARPERPVTLPLMKLRLPLAGWVSFLHRVSGVLLFFCLPLALWFLHKSLRGPESFAQLQQCLMQPAARVLLLLAVWALAHHLFAGIRHLLMDLHLGTSRVAARRSGMLVVIAAALVAAFAAGRLFA